MRSAARRLPWGAALGALAMAACAGDEIAFVAWPELEADALVFVVEVREGRVERILGPYDGEGPRPRLELEADRGVELVVLDRDALAALHPRVDVERWAAVRLIEQPAECLECEVACRAARNDLLFHPIRGLPRAFRLEDGAFAALPANPRETLWLELPARWDCADVSEPGIFERVARWSPEADHYHFFVLPDGTMLATTSGVRVIGSDPDLFIPVPANADVRNVSAVRSDRVYASIHFRNSDRGLVWELDLSPGRLELLRELEFDFAVTWVHAEERGLVVFGRQGDVATSTDALRFERHVISQLPNAISVAKLGTAERPFLLGAGAGAVFRGDPWDPGHVWTTDRVDLIVDSSVAQLLRTSARDAGGVLWARTHERGLFWETNTLPWRRFDAEMPGVHPRCRLRTNACGFGEPPARTRQASTAQDTLFLVADGCPIMLSLSAERSCVGSLEFEEDGFSLDQPRAVTVVGDFVYLMVPDGVLRAPLSALP